MKKLLWLIGPILAIAFIVGINIVGANPGAIDIAKDATMGSVSVSTTTVTLIMAERLDRIGSPIIQNMDGANYIQIVFGYETAPSTTVVTANGIKVIAGEVWSPGESYTGTIYGLANTAAVDVNTLEFHR